MLKATLVIISYLFTTNIFSRVRLKSSTQEGNSSLSGITQRKLEFIFPLSSLLTVEISGSCIVNGMKRGLPWSEQVDVISSDESSSSSSSLDVEVQINDGTTNFTIDQPPQELSSEGLLIRKAEVYQEYMKQLPIPTLRGSVIPFTSWMGLSRSIKQLYGQPLHYLTNILLKQWDQLRIGSEDEHSSLDTVIHPCKAEATVWLVEELHRQTSSHHHIAKLWLSDLKYHAFIDSIFPSL